MRRRIAVTGMGVITAAGADLQAFTASVAAGVCSLKPVTHPLLTRFPGRFAGTIDDRSFPDFITAEMVERYDRYVVLALIAAHQALDNAKIDAKGSGRKMGVICATCSGPTLTIEQRYNQLIKGNTAGGRIHDDKTGYDLGTRTIARQFGISGPCSTVTTACSAGTAALGIAADLIRAGAAECMLAGGADSFSPSTFAGFAGLKALSEGPCAPFSKPVGLCLGEGAGFLVLEGLDEAEERGATIFGEFLGYGFSNDAYHCSAPDPSGKGAVLAMEKALKNAGITASAISYVNAHGTGTEPNDKAETRAIRKVFGDLCDRLPVSSTKAAVGHCLGAAGAIETIAALACGRNGTVPPTARFVERRDGCALDYVPDVDRRWKNGPVFIKNSFAFGGNNASAVLSHAVLPQPLLESDPQRSGEETICITGFGLLTSAGIGVGPLIGVRADQYITSETVVAHDEPVGPLRPFSDSSKGRVPDFQLRDIDKRIDPRTDRMSMLSTAAVSMALTSASIPDRPLSRASVGFYLSLASGSTWAEAEHIGRLINDDYAIHQVASFPYVVPNSIAGSVCRTLSLTGHTTNFCDGPGGGLSTVCHAAVALRNGHCDRIVAGALDNTETSPEAAAMVVLETLSSAAGRNVKPLGTVCGYSLSSFNGTTPSEDVVKQTVEEALEKARIGREQVGVVCCRPDDNLEMSVVRKLFAPESVSIADYSRFTGEANACLPLINLIAALTDPRIERNSSTHYILALFGSLQGSTCALVAKRAFVPKE